MPTNKNTLKNSGNSHVVININSTTAKPAPKRRPPKKEAKPDAPPPRQPQTVHQTTVLTYPQASLISPNTHAPIPDYFQSALTNRDFALNALNTAAMAYDMHHSLRRAYAEGAVPGGIGTQTDAEAPPQQESEANTPSSMHTHPMSDVDAPLRPEDVPLPDDDPLDYDVTERHRLEVDDYEERFYNAPAGQRQRLAVDIRNIAQRHGIRVRDERGRLHPIHQVFHMLRVHFRRP